MDVIEVAAREVAHTDAALVLTPHPLTVQGQRVLDAKAAALVAGETLASFLSRHGVQAGQQWVVAIGGVEVPEILWGRVRPKHGHLIEARRRAQKSVLRLVAVAALIWFSGGLATGGVLGFAGGSFGATLVAGVVSMAGMAVINKLLGPKPLSGGNGSTNSVSPTYSLSGGRNRARMWEPMALVLGEPYCVPDLAAQPYNYFENGEQFLWQLFHAGLNCASVSAIRIGQTAITDYQAVAVYKAGFLSGNTGFPALAASVDTVAGALLDAPTAPGAYTTRTSSINAMHLAVDIECSLFIVDSKGKYGTWWVSIDLEYRAVGSGAWLAFVDGAPTQVLSNDSTRPLRLTLKRDVDPGQYEVRARKNTANETATDRQNAVQWTSLKSYQDASANYDYQAGVGVQIQASGQLTGALDEVNWQAVAKPMPYWNGSAWVTATSRANGLCNPGAIILMLARGVRDSSGRVLFGLDLADSQIDIEGLKDFMVWCASIGAEFDYFLQETVSIDELIDSVAAVGMGAKSWHTGKLGVIWFSDTQPIESVLNMSTVKAKSFSVTYDTAQTADEIEVQYFDRVRDNTWQSVRVLAPGVTQPTLTARVQLPGVTTEAAAALLARFSMAQNAFQRKTVSVEVDMEHLTFRRGTLVALSHDVTQWGYGGRVQSAVNASGTVTLTLDDVVPAGAGSRYVGLRIPGERSYRIFPVAAFSGTSRTLTLASAWPGGVPVPGDSAGNPAHDTIWIYDFKATPGHKLRVADVSPMGALDGARVSLVPDSPEMWTYIWSGTYTAPPNNSLLAQGVPVLSGVTFSEQRTLVGDVYLVDVTASYSVTGAFERVELFGSTGGAPLQPMTTSSGLQVSWRAEAGQVWSLELRPYSALHAGAVVAASYVVGNDWVPANYDTFSVTVLGDNTRVFTFAYTTTPVPADLSGAVIRFKKGAIGTELWSAMSPLHDGVLTNSPVESRAGDPDVYRFALKARSRSGIESTDATVRYVNIALPALSEPSGVSIDSDSIIFLEDATGTLTNPTVTLTAVLSGALAGATVTWSHSTGYGGSTPSGTNTWTVSGASQTADQVTYTATVTYGASTFTDSVVLYKMRQGAEQIVVVLTNPVISVPATAAGVVTTFTAQTSEMQVYYGGSLASDSLLTYTVASDPSGTGLAVASTGLYTLSFPGSPSGWWTSSAPSANVVLRAALVSDPTAYREITLVITKNLAGADGSSANDLLLNPSVLTFSFDTAGAAYPAAQSSVLTVTRVPGSLAGTVIWSATAYNSSGAQIGATGAVGLTGTGDSRTLTTANFMAPGGSFNNNIQYVTVTATLGSLSKSIRIIRTTDGQEAIISFLTNPAVTLPASSAGVVSSWTAATGDFQVWQGGTEVTSGITYAIQSNPSALTASINSTTGIYSVTDAGSWANGSATASITFRATHTATGNTRDAVLTLAKAVSGSAGTPGTPGAPGADAVVYEIETSVPSIARNNIGVMSPASVTFGFYKKTGSAARVIYAGRVIIETSSNSGVSWATGYASSSDEAAASLTAPSGITHMRARLHLTGGTTTQVAQITVPVIPDGIRSPMSLNSNSSATAVYGTVSSGAVVWADAKANEVVWRKLGYGSAPSATPADYLVRTDLVTLFDASPPTAGVKPATRYWTGSAWADPGTVIDGNLLVKGTVTLDSLKSGSTDPVSGVTFGLGTSWGPNTNVSGGSFHSGNVSNFALVADNTGGGYAIAAASSALDDYGSSLALWGGWSGFSLQPGGGYGGGTYRTSAYLTTGLAGGIFRYSYGGKTTDVRLGEPDQAATLVNGNYATLLNSTTFAGRFRYSSVTEALLAQSALAGAFTQGSYVASLGAASYAAEFKYGTTTNAKLGNTATAGVFTQGGYTGTLASAYEAVKAAYSTTNVVSLGTSAHAIDISAGDFKFGPVTIATPPNASSYLSGTGSWQSLYLDGSMNNTSFFDSRRPSGTVDQPNIWITIYVAGTKMHVPAWYG